MLVLIFLLVTLLAYYIQPKLKIFKFALIDMKPINWPLYGKILNELAQSPLRSLHYYKQIYGTRFTFWLGDKLLYFTIEPIDLEIILNEPSAINKLPQIYDKIKEFMGDGLLQANDEKWKIHRKYLNTSFSKLMLNSYLDSIIIKSELLIERLINNKQLILFEEISKFTLNSFFENFMKLNFNERYDELDFYEEYFQRGKNEAKNRMVKTLNIIDFIYFNTKDGKKHLKTVDSIRKFVKKLIKERENQPDDNLEDFLGLLLRLTKENVYNKQEVEEEILLFIATGSDTSALGIIGGCIMLALNPIIQENLYNEIIEVVGKNERLTKENLNNLKYLERVLLETQRLFPSAPLFVRQLKNDINLGHLKLPAGLGVITSTYSLHRNPDYWPEPMKFDPDRFLPDESANRNPYHYIPFSIGPRNCIGMKYGMLLMKVAMVHLVRKFTFKTTYKSIDDIIVDQAVTLNYVEGCNCTFELRQN